MTESTTKARSTSSAQPPSVEQPTNGSQDVTGEATEAETDFLPLDRIVENPAITQGSLTAALAQVQANLPPISKGQTATVQTKAGGSYSYSYANLAKIQPVILPLLAKEGLAWVTLPTYDEDRHFVLQYQLRHTSGDVISGSYPLPDPSRATPQEIGSAITYSRRYALCSVVGIAPDEDDDDAQAAQSAPPAQARNNTPVNRSAAPSDAGT